MKVRVLVNQCSHHYSDTEKETWKMLYQGLQRCRLEQAHPIFQQGVDKLGLAAEPFPDITQVNQRLEALTGWRGIPVEGLVDNPTFFKGLAVQEFPIGNFIRSKQDLGYTPAPDIFHDLYGHLPFLADTDFAAFCQKFGEVAARDADDPYWMERWGRLFWFGVEFPVIKTAQGRRVFGGGILSSQWESDYALSGKPEVRNFSLQEIFEQPYNIDEFQKVIFELESPQQLYSCLDSFKSEAKAG